MSLNPEAQAELDRILAIDPAARTEAENAFLSARSDYHEEKVKAEKPKKEDK